MAIEATTLGSLIARGNGFVQTGPFGSQLHATDYVEEGVPVVMPVNIGDNRIIEAGIARVREADAARLSRHRLRAGDIVYSRRGDVERRALVREEQSGWLCGTGCLLVRPGTSVDPRYLSFLLGSGAARSWLVRHAQGATMPNLNTSILSALPLTIHEKPEQLRIAHILGTLDDKIELNRRMNETLEEMARALFKSWFVDFDPVRAKAEGRDTGLPKHLADLFPDRLVDSKLGPIPEGWQVVRFSETVTVASGGTPKTSMAAYWSGDIPWFSVADAPSPTDVWVTRTMKRVTQRGIDSCAASVVPKGTTILSARGTVGKVALAGRAMAFNQSCYGFPVRPGELGYFTYFTTLGIVNSLRQRAHGSVFSTITRATLDSIKVIAVPRQGRDAFEATVEPLMERILAANIESETLKHLRDAQLTEIFAPREQGDLEGAALE